MDQEGDLGLVQEEPAERFGEAVEERQSDGKIKGTLPADPKERPVVWVDGQDLESGRNVGLRQPGAAARQADEGDGVVDGGVCQGVVGAGDQAVDAGDGAALGGREVDDQPLLARVLACGHADRAHMVDRVGGTSHEALRHLPGQQGIDHIGGLERGAEVGAV